MCDVKAKKATIKELKKGLSKLSITSGKGESAEFLPLEGGPGRQLSKSETLENTAAVLYIGRIPHGFYENEMEGGKVLTDGTNHWIGFKLKESDITRKEHLKDTRSWWKGS